MKQITKEELFEMFDESVHGAISRNLARTDVTHMVVCENNNFDSSRFGDRAAVIVGPGCTWQTLEIAAQNWLGDLPSQRRYPTYYYEKEGQDGTKHV